MGFFSKLGRVFRDISDPGGTLIYKATGGKGSRPNTLKSGLNPIAQPKAPAPGSPFTPKGPYTPEPGGDNFAATRLGWTNGGYNYANNPAPGFGGGQMSAQTPSFSMGQPPPTGGGFGMGASGPQQLQVGNPAGSMPSAGAPPPMGQPTSGMTGALINRLRIPRPNDPQRPM
jgi:hypothetical protein